MHQALSRSLHRFRPRIEIRDFELSDRRWRRELPPSVRCVLASLVIHHLSGAEKERLFRDLAARLRPGGALLIVDIVEPANDRVRELFAEQWDDAGRAQHRAPVGRAQSAETVSGREAFARFQAERWNYYSDDAPDPYDQPSRLSDQLRWLERAGFSHVDCFWMRAGHAIFGGSR